MLEILGTLTGLLYLWLEYKASIHLWLVGVIMPALYIMVYYEAGLYADCGINVYYLLAALYGWWEWHRHIPATESLDSTPPIQSFCQDAAFVARACRLIGTTMFLFVGIAWLLLRFTDSTVPWLDAFTTALSITAMWMLAKRYVEQWLVWIVVDVVSAGLYVYKELYFTAGLYLLYALIAVLGYRKWKQLLHTS